MPEFPYICFARSDLLKTGLGLARLRRVRKGAQTGRKGRGVLQHGIHWLWTVCPLHVSVQVAIRPSTALYTGNLSTAAPGPIASAG